jgi:protein involved in polysaccharide export with SLBB domain
MTLRRNPRTVVGIGIFTAIVFARRRLPAAEHGLWGHNNGCGAMMKNYVSLGVVVAIGLLLAGCYTDYGPVAAVPDPIPPPAAASFLHLGDRVTVNVYDEPNLTGVYDVTPTGTLDLPLIGAVRAVGRTPRELERTITERYKSGKFLTEPEVTVSVVSYEPVYLFGEVVKPGEYPYRSGMDVLALVTTAGGLTYRGRRDTVLIQHAGDPAWTEYPLLSSVIVLPGDHIRIPERYY